MLSLFVSCVAKGKLFNKGSPLFLGRTQIQCVACTLHFRAGGRNRWIVKVCNQWYLLDTDAEGLPQTSFGFVYRMELWKAVGNQLILNKTC